jgi:hypothetical protein
MALVILTFVGKFKLTEQIEKKRAKLPFSDYLDPQSRNSDTVRGSGSGPPNSTLPVVENRHISQFVDLLLCCIFTFSSIVYVSMAYLGIYFLNSVTVGYFFI